MASKLRVSPSALEQSSLTIRPPRRLCVRCLLIQRRSYATERTRYAPRWKEEAKNPEEEALRRRFESWINGPGAAFRRPLPGSTNYLNAYSKQGTLIRKALVDKEAKTTAGKAEKEKQHGNEADTEEFELSEEERARRAEQLKELEKAAKENSTGERRLPPESTEDLRPFPLNRNFVSERVLSEELREMLYIHVKERGRTIRQVSADFKVSIERVAAVVRMKQMERDWLAKGKMLATPYSRQVLAMLPQTQYRGEKAEPHAHESINDLPVHPATTAQIFYPASESRAFTREDAGHAFRPGLLPADKRIPHPELVQLEKMKLNSATKDEITDAMIKYSADEAKAIEMKKMAQKAREAKEVKVYKGFRWDFKFTDFSLDSTIGKDERSRRAVGARYGMPHEDRKRGQVKIPTSVA